jgi:hypothetical protein
MGEVMPYSRSDCGRRCLSEGQTGTLVCGTNDKGSVRLRTPNIGGAETELEILIPQLPRVTEDPPRFRIYLRHYARIRQRTASLQPVLGMNG